MHLNLSDVLNNPKLLTFKVSLPSGETITLRPLEHSDISSLAQFLEKLSPKTRQYYILDSYNFSTAEELCDAINRYDKLRFIAEDNSAKNFVALFEFSFDIPKNDEERFLRYGVKLNPKTDCRIGLCIADEYQNKGIGSLFFPYLLGIAKLFGQKRMILWGGVFAINKRALKFYEKNGFKKLGVFNNKNGGESIDMMIFKA